MQLGWEILVVTQWLAIVILAAIVLGVLRQITPVLERAVAIRAAASDPLGLGQGPRIGDRLPHFMAQGPEGTVLSEGQLDGRASVLLFLSPGCGPCTDLLQEIGQADLGRLSDELVIVTTGSQDQGALGTATGPLVLTEPDGEVSAAFKVKARPFAVAVDKTGIVRGSGFANHLH